MSADDLLHITARKLPTTPASGQHRIDIEHAGFTVTYFWHMGERLCGWIVDRIERITTVG